MNLFAAVSCSMLFLNVFLNLFDAILKKLIIFFTSSSQLSQSLGLSQRIFMYKELTAAAFVFT